MGFDFGSFLGGFAEKVVEERDKATRSAKDLAETTAKYHLQRAMEGKAEKDKQYRTALDMATKLRSTYNYKPEQLLTLAENGRLEDVLKYHDEVALSKPGLKISPDQVVTMAATIPEGTTFDDAFKKAVIGIPTAMDIKELMPEPTRRGGFLMPDTSSIYRETADDIFSAAGMDMQEALQYSSDAFTRPTTTSSKIDMSPFGTLGTEAKLTEINRIARNIEDSVANDLGVERKLDGYGNLIGVDGESAKKTQFYTVQSNVRSRAFELITEGVPAGRVEDVIRDEMATAGGPSKWLTSRKQSTSTSTSKLMSTEERSSRIEQVKEQLTEAELGEIQKEYEQFLEKEPEAKGSITFDDFLENKVFNGGNITTVVEKPTVTPAPFSIDKLDWSEDGGAESSDLVLEYLEENGVITQDERQQIGSLPYGEQRVRLTEYMAMPPKQTTDAGEGGEGAGGQVQPEPTPLGSLDPETQQLLSLPPQEFMPFAMGVEGAPTMEQVQDYLTIYNFIKEFGVSNMNEAMRKIQAYMNKPEEERARMRSSVSEEDAVTLFEELQKLTSQSSAAPTTNLNTRQQNRGIRQ